MKKLTDAQRVILAAAAARDYGNVLPIPDSLKFSAGTRAIVLMGLTAKGLLAERTAADDEPVWRVDEQAGKIALVISPAGLQAIGVEPNAAATVPAQGEVATGTTKPARRAATRHPAERGAKSPRETKQSVVIALLRRQDGASVEELVAATSWAPHSVRGFMSGALKKRLGMTIISEKGADGIRRYLVGPLRTSENQQ